MPLRADDYPPLHEAMEPTLRAARLYDRRFRTEGVSIEDTVALVPDLLDFAASPRRNDEVEAWLEARFGEPKPRIWWAMRQYGPFVHASTGGAWSFGTRPTYVGAFEQGRPGDPAASTRHLVRRYLQAFGPATPADIAAFSTIYRPPVQAAVRELGDELVTLDGPAGPLLDVPGAPLPDEDTPAPPRLLPMWDSVLLAYKDRSRIIPADYRRVVIRSNGDVLPTLLVDGYVAGVWRPVDGVIEATAFHPLPDEAWAGLEAEASAPARVPRRPRPRDLPPLLAVVGGPPGRRRPTPRLMRVLFTCVVGPGHFNPMAPLALAFRAAGHDVAVATDPSLRPARPGGRASTPSPRASTWRWRSGGCYREVPNWRDVAPWDQARHIVRGIFGGSRIEPMLADLEPILRDWRPDLLIHDSAEMAGAIAATVEGIAHAEHSFGVLRPMDLREVGTEAIDPVCRRLGVPNPGVGGLGGERYLDICPPTFQRPEIADVPDVQPIRPDRLRRRAGRRAARLARRAADPPARLRDDGDGVQPPPRAVPGDPRRPCGGARRRGRDDRRPR